MSTPLEEKQAYMHRVDVPGGGMIHWCPFSGEYPDHVWSDHNRPNVFNSCRYCSDDKEAAKGAGNMLHRLQERRRLEDAS